MTADGGAPAIERTRGTAAAAPRVAASGSPGAARRPIDRGCGPAHVLHIVPWFAAGGGVQRYVREVVEHQRAQGLDVTLLTTSAHADESDPAYVLRVPAPLFVLRTPFAPAFRAAIERSEADLVHVHGPNPLVDWAVLGLERPYVYSLYNPFPALPRAARPLVGFGKRLSRWAIERSLGVAVLDPGLAQESWVGGDRPVWHIPPGVDHEVFRPQGLPRKREVVFAGHVRPEKGLHVLIDAMRLLPDVRLRVLASVKYARAYAERERRRAAHLLGDRFAWESDPTDEDLARAFNVAGCVVVPSTGLETWNLVMLEAAACGAPVVASDLPALDWARFALRARTGDVSALALAIAEALERGPGLSQAAIDSARAYRWDRTSERLGAFYREALAAGAASQPP